VGTPATIVHLTRTCAATETDCADGKDDDCNGLVDCRDPACATSPACTSGGPCQGATPLACNSTVTGSTDGGPTRLARYACDPWLELGAEAYYRLTPTASGQVTAKLSGLGTDLDLVVLRATASGACDPTSGGCLASSSTSGPEQVTFTVTAAQPYYLVVDGYNGASGAFTLQVTCP
jgi:hypothetical protein